MSKTRISIECSAILVALLAWQPGPVAAQDCNGNGVPDTEEIGPLSGYALDFDGVDDYLSMPDDLIHNSTTLTVEAWFRTTGSGVILGYQDTSYPTPPTHYVPAIYVGTDGKLRGQFWHGGTSPISSPDAVNDGVWRHVALVAAVNTQSLYLNGQLVGTLSGQIDHLDMSFDQIGVGNSAGWPAGNGSWFHFAGLIDEIRIWHVARSQEEIQDLMSESLVGNETGLIAYYRLDEGSGTTAGDSAGGDHDGTLLNGPAWVAAITDCNTNGVPDDCDVAQLTNDTDVPLFDNDTAFSTIAPDLPGVVTDLDVVINIQHTWDEDLDVFLILAGEISVELFTDVGLDGDNFTGNHPGWGCAHADHGWRAALHRQVRS